MSDIWRKMRVWSEALKCSRSRAASHETVKLNLIHAFRSTSLNLYLDLWQFRETQLRLSILRRNDGRKFHRWGAKEKNARSPYPLRMKLSAKSKQRVWKIFILREYVIEIVSKKKLWWCTLVRKLSTYCFYNLWLFFLYCYWIPIRNSNFGLRYHQNSFD